MKILSSLELWISPLKMTFAAVVSGVAVYIPLKLFDQLVFDTSRTFGLMLLTGIAGMLGLMTYILLSWLFDIGEVHAFLAMMRRVSKAAPVLFAPANEVINDREKDTLA